MKNRLQYFLYLVAIITIFSSCEKRQLIEEKAFGMISVSSIFAGEASPLLIEVDGVSKGRLTVEVPRTLSAIILETGPRNLKLINEETGDILTDTTLIVEAAKTLTLPLFFYTGSAALFDDLDATPQPDSMLVRFVTLDPTLPNAMDIEISLWDFASEPIRLTDKNVGGVTKTDFSEFIQLPHPSLLLPPGTDPTYVYYVIEGYDTTTGEKVMSMENWNISMIIDLNTNANYIANGVISMGIGAASDFDPTHLPEFIFQRIAK